MSLGKKGTRDWGEDIAGDCITLGLLGHRNVGSGDLSVPWGVTVITGGDFSLDFPEMDLGGGGGRG